VHVDTATWGRIPLAVLLDPGAARSAFTTRASGPTLTLTPRQPSAELAELQITVGEEGLPVLLVLLDASGARNEFRLAGWRGIDPPAIEQFRPSLPGAPPCVPAEE
jgi:hypothetical protein